MNPTNRDNAEHYTWPSAIGPQVCDGWRLHCSDALSIIEERMPPGTAEQRHLHRRATQFFYVLAGELTIERAGETMSLTAGDGCNLPAQTPHQVFNHGPLDARFLVVSQPPSHGDRVAAEVEMRISTK